MTPPFALPDTHQSITHKLKIEDFKVFITIGLDDSGQPRRIDITMDGAHATARGIAHAWASSATVALKYGAPLDALISEWIYQRFPPAGLTGNPEIPFSNSIADYVARWLRLTFSYGQGAEASAQDHLALSSPDLVGAPASPAAAFPNADQQKGSMQ